MGGVLSYFRRCSYCGKNIKFSKLTITKEFTKEKLVIARFCQDECMQKWHAKNDK